jgi:hypothetical protein
MNVPRFTLHVGGVIFDTLIVINWRKQQEGDETDEVQVQQKVVGRLNKINAMTTKRPRSRNRNDFFHLITKMCLSVVDHQLDWIRCLKCDFMIWKIFVDDDVVTSNCDIFV